MTGYYEDTEDVKWEWARAKVTDDSEVGAPAFITIRGERFRYNGCDIGQDSGPFEGEIFFGVSPVGVDPREQSFYVSNARPGRFRMAMVPLKENDNDLARVP